MWQETGCSQRCVDIHVQRGTTSQHHPVGLRMMQTPTDLKGHETPAQTVCCGQSLNFDSRSKLLQQQVPKKLLTVRSSGSGNPYSCQCTKPQTLKISKTGQCEKTCLCCSDRFASESPSLLIGAKMQDMLQLLKTFAATLIQLQAGRRCMRAAT